MRFKDWVKSFFSSKQEPVQKKRKYGERTYGVATCRVCHDEFTKRTPRHAVCDNRDCQRRWKTAQERARRGNKRLQQSASTMVQLHLPITADSAQVEVGRVWDV